MKQQEASRTANVMYDDSVIKDAGSQSMQCEYPRHVYHSIT